MKLEDAAKLIRHKYLEEENSTWIDLGCGNGLFTYALANNLLRGSTVHAIDKSNGPLAKLPNPNQTSIVRLQLDFEKDELPFENLTGILMANSLHYIRDKLSFIKKAEHALIKGGYFLIVEYDTDRANQWVPYPCGYKTLTKIFENAGYQPGIKIGEISSIFGSGNIYSALFKMTWQ